MIESWYNEKLKDDYMVFACIKEEKYDMLLTINEFTSSNYTKIHEMEDKNNFIVILRKN